MVACDVEPEGFTIRGKLSNAAGKMVFLTSDEYRDSTLVSPEGSFTFFGQIPEAEFLYLYVNPANSVLLLVDTIDNLEVNGDAEDLFNTFEVKGSKNAEAITELYEKFADRLAELRQIAPPTPDEPDSVLLAKRETAGKIITNHRDYLRNYVRENISSLAVLPALYQSFDTRSYVLNPETDYELFKEVDDSLMANHPGSKHVKQLHANLIEVKRKIDFEKSRPKDVTENAEAPDFSVPDPEGNEISLSSLKGKYVLLDFWASWCSPCRIENPTLVNAYEKFHSKGFEIFQVSLDKSKDAWVKAIEKDGLKKWKHASDLKFWQCVPARQYGVQSIPANFLITPDGKIIAKNLRGAALEQKLSEIFNK